MENISNIQKMFLFFSFSLSLWPWFNFDVTHNRVSRSASKGEKGEIRFSKEFRFDFFLKLNADPVTFRRGVWFLSQQILCFLERSLEEVNVAIIQQIFLNDMEMSQNNSNDESFFWSWKWFSLYSSWNVVLPQAEKVMSVKSRFLFRWKKFIFKCVFHCPFWKWFSAKTRQLTKSTSWNKCEWR